MNANRVTGPGSPDSNKPADQKVHREAAQRVEKVQKIDPDEQTRQQRFKQIMQPAKEEESTQVSSPSPFETSFHLPNGSQDASDFDLESVPSPSYSQPPNVSPSSEGTLSDEDLPQSDGFWHDVDLPDQPIEKPHLKEEVKPAAAAKSGKEGKVKGQHPNHAPKKVEPSPFGPPGKSPPKQEATPLQKKKGESEEPETTPSGRYWTPEGEVPSVARPGLPGKPPSKEEEQPSLKGPLKGKTAPKEIFQPPLKGFDSSMASPSRTKDEEREGEKGGGSKPHKIDIIAPTLPELPIAIQQAAQTATMNAIPYLRPETLPLFFQMVGSILIMSTPPGISRTEIVLNNPAFASSKFFGSSIEIIKYSTAPDSFNIRLTGSNEAVAAFNANIPSLMAAFQTGHFPFRIGRIDAEYTTEKPVLRRKDSKGDSGAGGDQQEKRR